MSRDMRFFKHCPDCGLGFFKLGFHKCVLYSTPTTPPPFCACGCGEQVKGYMNGVWGQWRPGHNMRGRANVSGPGSMAC